MRRTSTMTSLLFLLLVIVCLGAAGCEESSGNRQQPSGDTDKDLSPSVDVERVGPGTVRLAWDANSEPDLAGYRMHIGQDSRSYDRELDVGNQTTVEVDNLEAGRTYYFAVTAYNEGGLESDYSNEVSYTEPEE